MAKHEFELLARAPLHGERYDAYEPDTASCVSVDDAHIERRMWLFDDLSCYAHALDVPYKGLVYCGITLIPPHSANEMYWMIHTDDAMKDLAVLLLRAAEENRYVIHYGL